nr:fibroblast growth factor 2 [Zonotrichia albicollis]
MFNRSTFKRLPRGRGTGEPPRERSCGAPSLPESGDRGAAGTAGEEAVEKCRSSCRTQRSHAPGADGLTDGAAARQRRGHRQRRRSGARRGRGRPALPGRGRLPGLGATGLRWAGAAGPSAERAAPRWQRSRPAPLPAPPAAAPPPAPCPWLSSLPEGSSRRHSPAVSAPLHRALLT